MPPTIAHEVHLDERLSGATDLLSPPDVPLACRILFPGLRGKQARKGTPQLDTEMQMLLMGLDFRAGPFALDEPLHAPSRMNAAA